MEGEVGGGAGVEEGRAGCCGKGMVFLRGVRRARLAVGYC